MDPEEISKNADKERLRKKMLSEKPTIKKEVVKKTAAPYSFKVYAKIFPSNFRIVLWIFFVAAIGAVFFFLWLLGDFGIWALYLGIGLMSLFTIRLFVEQLRKIFTYRTYKHFKENLPFELIGWEKLGADPKLLKIQYWAHECVVEVTVQEGAGNLDIKRINDALFLFISAANKNFYEGRFGSDGRKKWAFHHVLKATGSADTAVIGEMYRLVQVYLKSIHQKYPVVKSVHIVFGDHISKVEPPVTVD